MDPGLLSVNLGMEPARHSGKRLIRKKGGEGRKGRMEHNLRKTVNLAY